MRATVAAALLAVGLATAPTRAQVPLPRWLAPREARPVERLPDDVRPLATALDLVVDPARERFGGTVRTRVVLDRPRDVVWLHAAGLDLTEAFVEDAAGSAVAARVDAGRAGTVVGLRLARRIGPGEATLVVTWSAPFATQGPGLRRITVGDARYVVAELRFGSARRMLPCFDEPRFTTPWDVRVVTPAGLAAVSNARVFATTAATDGMQVVRFERTPPLTAHRLALAVGPFEVVDGGTVRTRRAPARRVPVRGFALRGGGRALAPVLRDVRQLAGGLERVVGLPLPSDKLDVVAVPGARDLSTVGVVGAWEATLVPSVARPRALGREVARQWFGATVGPATPDERWLTAALAEWAGSHALRATFPDMRDDLAAVELLRVAMDRDGLDGARPMREPVTRARDLRTGTDPLVVAKGAAVLGAFERWTGPAAFRAGVRRLVDTHRGGGITTDDLAAAVRDASGHEIGPALRTFVEQAGVPLVAGRLRCDRGPPRLEVRQTRWLPVGSWGDRGRSWQIPLCIRTGRGDRVVERCELLAAPAATIPLGATCPDWVLPNADGAGYYRWTLPTADLGRLLAFGWPTLTSREHLVTVDAAVSAFAAGTFPAHDLLAAFDVAVGDPTRAVAAAPMPVIRFVHDHVIEPPLRGRVETWARELYELWWQRLGWARRHGDGADRMLMRGRLVELLARVAHDPAVRREAAARGRRHLGLGGRPTPVAPELLETAVAVAVEQGGSPVVDAIVARLRHADDGAERQRLVRGLGAAREPALADRVLALSLDPVLRPEERLLVLEVQLREGGTRERAWSWLVAHLAALVAAVPEADAARLPWLAVDLCDQARAAEVRARLAPTVERLPGGPAHLEGAVEAIHLCAARAAAQRASTRSFFTL